MRGRGLRERSRPPLPDWCARPRKPRPPPRGCCCARPHVGRPASLPHPFPREGRKGVAGPRLARPTFSSSYPHQSERRCHPAPPDRGRGGRLFPSLRRLFIGRGPTNDERRSGRKERRREPPELFNPRGGGAGARVRAIGGDARGPRCGWVGRLSLRARQQPIGGRWRGLLGRWRRRRGKRLFSEAPLPPSASLPSAAT